MPVLLLDDQGDAGPTPFEFVLLVEFISENWLVELIARCTSHTVCC